MFGVSVALYYPINLAGVPLIVRQNKLGLAFSFVICFFNIGVTIAPLIVGGLRKITKTYFLS